MGTNLIPNYFQLFQTFFITIELTNTAYLYTKSIEGSRTKKHVHTILDFEQDTIIKNHKLDQSSTYITMLAQTSLKQVPSTYSCI